MTRLPNASRLFFAGLGLLGVCAVGSLGYRVLYGWSWTESVYMTVISITSVGFGEVHPLDDTGRWFTIFLVLAGIGVLTYGVTNFMAFVVEGELGDFIRRNRMEKKISALSGHYVVCGAGRIGEQVVHEFHRLGHKVVVIDQAEKALTTLEESYPGLLTVVGDATDDAVLRRANVTRATGVATALSNDADNLFVVLSVRQMCPEARIIARIDNEGSESKMKKAGADRAICPAHIGGQRIASELLRPFVVDFLERMTREGDGTLRMEEVRVAEGNQFIGKSLSEAQLPAKVGCVVVALKRANGDYVFNPQRDTLLSVGDTLIVIAEIDRLHALREMMGATLPS